MRYSSMTLTILSFVLVLALIGCNSGSESGEHSSGSESISESEPGEHSSGSESGSESESGEHSSGSESGRVRIRRGR